jgi:hypothetical protein
MGGKNCFALVLLERRLAVRNRLGRSVGEGRIDLDLDLARVNHLLRGRLADDVCLFPVKC